MNLSTLYWREPLWLLLMLLPVLILLITMVFRLIRNDDYADKSLQSWARMRQQHRIPIAWRRTLATLIAWCLLVLGLAGPRIPERIISTDPSQASEVMLVIDLSRSMSATDVLPNRLERAKLKLQQLIQSAQNVRFGIVVFAAQPHLLCPPTADKNVLQFYLSSLRTRLLPTEGSQVEHALRFATHYLDAQRNNTGSILLVSDGDGLASQPITALEHVRVHVMAVGTEEGTSLLDPQRGWLNHEGQPVLSRTDSRALAQLAKQGQGLFVTLQNDNSDWTSILNTLQTSSQNITRNTPDTSLIIWHELYHGFVIAGLLLFILSHWTFIVHSNSTTKQLNLLVCILAVGLMGIPTSSHAADTAQYRDAYKAWQQQHYAKAQKLFSAIPGYDARLGEGHTEYQQGHLPQAITQYVQAFMHADTDPQRAVALFNLGNVYYKQLQYEHAAQLYQDALHYQPDLRVAKINLQFAEELRSKNQSTSQPRITAQRAGRGPRSALASPDMDISQGRLSLDDSREDKKLPIAIQETTPINKSSTLEKTTTVTAAQEDSPDAAWTYDSERIDPTVMQALPYQQDNAGLWKRLFEWEENFPAPVATPHDVPGVKPW